MGGSDGEYVASWRDIITLLLSVGHSWADIQHYTISQIKEFSKAAVRLSELQRAASIQAIALGAQGTKDGIEKAIDALLRT